MKDEKPEHITRWVTGVRSGKLDHVIGEVKQALADGKTVRLICDEHQIQALETLGIPSECITTVSEVYHMKTLTNLHLSAPLFNQISDPRMITYPGRYNMPFPKWHGSKAPHRYTVILREMARAYYLGKIGIKERSNYIDYEIEAYLDRNQDKVFAEMYGLEKSFEVEGLDDEVVLRTPSYAPKIVPEVQLYGKGGDVEDEEDPKRRDES